MAVLIASLFVKETSSNVLNGLGGTWTKIFPTLCSRMSAACSKNAIGDFAVESVESHLKTSQGTSVHKVVVGRNVYAA